MRPITFFRCSAQRAGGERGRRTAMKALSAAAVLLAGFCGPAVAQTANSTAPVVPSVPAVQSGTSSGPAGIPLGSTELAPPGESPVILPLGAAFPSLGSSLQMPPSPLGGTAGAIAPYTAGAGSAVPGQNSGANCAAATGLSGTLPARLFSGRPAMGLQASGAANCQSSGSVNITNGNAALAYRPLAGRSGIPLGASALPGNGTAGVIAATPALPGY